MHRRLYISADIRIFIQYCQVYCNILSCCEFQFDCAILKGFNATSLTIPLLRGHVEVLYVYVILDLLSSGLKICHN